MSIKKFNIEIPKMDYAIINLGIRKNNELAQLGDNDQIYFTVRKTPFQDIIFQKSLENGIIYNPETNKYQIEIFSEDTKDLQFAIYNYDITIYYEGNKPKQKVIGEFKIGIKYTLNEVV